MPTDHSGAGDPIATLELLWRSPSGRARRGPRRGLTIDAIADAATELADETGLELLTMRRLAERLGVAAMTLYGYVPGKAELLDLLLDAAYSRMPRTNSSGMPWRRRVTAVADENRALFETHRWAATTSTSRPPLGPGLMAKYEHELSALDGLGLTDAEMDDALTFVLGFVQGWARDAAAARDVRADTAMDDEQWWAASSPVLAQVFDEDAFPLAVRVGGSVGTERGGAYSPEHAYAFGLARVLDGLATLVGDRG